MGFRAETTRSQIGHGPGAVRALTVRDRVEGQAMDINSRRTDKKACGHEAKLH